jgi:hypothetical protein
MALAKDRKGFEAPEAVFAQVVLVPRDNQGN